MVSICESLHTIDKLIRMLNMLSIDIYICICITTLYIIRYTVYVPV